jgi:tryptophan halogenase
MKICIVGGGTAGWLAAFLFSKIRSNNEYIVVESSSIGIIGVGEGTTAFFGSILKDYGLDEFDFMHKTGALPKMGIRFKNWTGDEKSFDASLTGSYTAYSGYTIDSAMYAAIYKNYNLNYCGEESTLTHYNKTNLFLSSDGSINNYTTNSQAMHFDAYKVGEYFKDKCFDSLYQYEDSKILDVVLENEKIKSLILENGKVIEADLFIDCSGFSKILCKKLNQKYISYDDMLPLDRSYLFKLKEDKNDKISCTMAWARDNGWIFEIPTRNRIGRGYIYCSKFATEENIHKELESIYKTEVVHVKTIHFNSERIENAAFSNCLALGLCSSFFEPLQATSIHNTIIQIMTYIHDVLCDNIEDTLNPTAMQCYNKKTAKLFNDTADFISLHYTGGREDTEFWKYCKYERKLGDRANQIINLMKTRLTRFYDWEHYYGQAGYPLWNIVLGGLGHVNKETIEKQFKLWNFDMETEFKNMTEQQEKTEEMIDNLMLLSPAEIDTYFNEKYLNYLENK